MALATYSDLQTAIASYLARVGDTIITAAAPDLVTLAESRIAYGAEDPQAPFPSAPLRIRPMETSLPLIVKAATTATSVGGTANAITLTNTTPVTSLGLGSHVAFTAALTNTGATTMQVDATTVANLVKGSARSALTGGEVVISGNYEAYFDGTYWVLMPGSADVPLPAGYLAMRSVYVDVSPRRSLDFLTPDQLNEQFPWSTAGEPRAFTIEADAIRFGPSPDGPYSAVCLYYQKFPALSSSTTTNWLMTNKPDVYLYASLLESAIFTGDDDGAKRYHALFMSACNGLQAQDERDRHSGARLTVRVRGMTP